MAEGRDPRRAVVVGGLGLLGLAMLVLGAVAGLAPPILTGVGFLLIAWGWPRR